jgi:ribose-phosphate pyrophosphokinase
MEIRMNNLAIFSGTANPELAKDICDYIGIPVGDAIVSHFPDGETMVKVDDEVRGKDCFIVQPTCTPVNANIMELLIFIDCLRRASAKSISVVIPYYGYARQDRKSEGRTPITARMVADLLTWSGINRVLTMDLHASQIEGFFNMPVDHLTAFPAVLSYLKSHISLEDITILSPDVGNMKMGEKYAQALDADLSVIDKRRINGEEAVATRLVGDVDGKHVLMFDDMISTAGTICSAARMAKEHGAIKISVFATHGLFTGPATIRLMDSPIDNIYITDTVPLSKSMQAYSKFNTPAIEVISVAKLLGEAIVRIYQDRSVSVLLESDYENHMH